MPTIPNGYRQVASGRLVLLKPNYNRPLVNAKDFSKIKKRYNVNDTLLQKAISDNPSIELFLKRYPDAAPVFSQFVPRPQKMKIISQLEGVIPSDEASNIEFLKRVVDTFPMSFPVISAESMMAQLTPSEADLIKNQGVIGLLNASSAGGSSLEEAIRELTQTLRSRGVPPDAVNHISDAVSNSVSSVTTQSLADDTSRSPLLDRFSHAGIPPRSIASPADFRRDPDMVTHLWGPSPSPPLYSKATPHAFWFDKGSDSQATTDSASMDAGPVQHYDRIRAAKGVQDLEDDGLSRFLRGEFDKSATAAGTRAEAEEPKFSELVDTILVPKVAPPADAAASQSPVLPQSLPEEVAEELAKTAEFIEKEETAQPSERVSLLDLAQRLYDAYNPLKGRVKAKTDQKVLEMRDKFIDELYYFMTIPRSGRAELTPVEAKQIYDIVERGVPFPRYKLAKRRPILDNLMGLRREEKD